MPGRNPEVPDDRSVTIVPKEELEAQFFQPPSPAELPPSPVVLEGLDLDAQEPPAWGDEEDPDYGLSASQPFYDGEAPEASGGGGRAVRAAVKAAPPHNLYVPPRTPRGALDIKHLPADFGYGNVQPRLMRRVVGGQITSLLGRRTEGGPGRFERAAEFHRQWATQIIPKPPRHGTKLWGLSAKTEIPAYRLEDYHHGGEHDVTTHLKGGGSNQYRLAVERLAVVAALVVAAPFVVKEGAHVEGRIAGHEVTYTPPTPQTVEQAARPAKKVKTHQTAQPLTTNPTPSTLAEQSPTSIVEPTRPKVATTPTINLESCSIVSYTVVAGDSADTIEEQPIMDNKIPKSLIPELVNLTWNRTQDNGPDVSDTLITPGEKVYVVAGCDLEKGTVGKS